MTFEEAVFRYQQLRAEWAAGRMAPSDFQNAVAELNVCDAEGNWWRMEAQTGAWTRWDGSAWVQSPPQAVPKGYPPSAAGPYGASAAPTATAGWAAPGVPQAPVQPQGPWPASQPPPPAYAQAASQPMLAPVPKGRQIFFDIIAMLGSTAMAGAWYWYSGLSNETPPDKRTCITMVLLPLLLIVFRGPLDRLLMPLQKFRAGIPRMVLLGTGIAIPFLVSNFLYAKGFTQYDFLFRTYLVSTLLSYVVLRTPSMRVAGGRR